MKKTMVAVALSAFIITGCASDVSNAQKGAGIGAVLGALAGKGTGDNDKKRYVWGAALGALAGGAIGSYMDKQEEATKYFKSSINNYIDAYKPPDIMAKCLLDFKL